MADVGRVSIVGAGPGDPALITLAARDRLAEADVVIADYLANPALLLWCRPDAVILQRRRGPRSDTPLPPGSLPLPQSAVNAAILAHARAGKHVVRLKGGDPCMFGRGAEEAAVLAEAEIPYELIPGVSSPIAAPECAGIPVTHREFTPAVTFVSGFEAYEKAGLHVAWEHLARSAGTIVLMMSVGNVADNAERLIQGGREASTPAAMVRWGSRGIQQTIVGSLANIGDKVMAAGLRPPAVLVVGDVVRLREKIAWLERRPLFGRRVVVTRSLAQGRPLRGILAQMGADVVPIPCLSIAGPSDPLATAATLRRIPTAFDGIILSSPNGVRMAVAALLEAGEDLRALAGKTIAVIGAATARACRAAGLNPDVIPATPRAEGLIAALGDTLAGRWLLLRGEHGRDTLPKAIEAAGGRCEIASVYRAQRPALPEPLVQSLLPASAGGEGADAICFASGKTAEHFMATAAEAVGAAHAWALVRAAQLVSLGPVTTQALAAMGLDVAATATEPTDAAIAAAVASVLPPPSRP